MRIVAISDTHNLQKHFPPLPEADMIIHCGDMTTHGKHQEFFNFNSWWRNLRYKHKILIPGNHDRCLASDPSLEMMLKEYCHYLVDDSVEIEGLVFHGSPWVLTFLNYPFMMDEGGDLEHKWSLIPDKTDVLITHGPPYGIRDFVTRNSENAGSMSLLEAVLRIKPQVHVFGHIHENYGQEEHAGIKFINAASHKGPWKDPDDPYHSLNAPMVFEVTPRKAN
jgi:Icc-related predicted phosphoesterase